MKKVAVITGTTSGIGRAIASYYNYEGFDTIGVNKREEDFPVVDQTLIANLSEPKEVRTLIKKVNGLEQWRSYVKTEFPINSDFLRETLTNILIDDIKDFNKDECTFSDFEKYIYFNPYIRSINVYKERFAYTVNNTICEFAKVKINNVNLVSISTESIELKDILKNNNN